MNQNKQLKEGKAQNIDQTLKSENKRLKKEIQRLNEEIKLINKK
jgi:hypothetical protein